MARRVIVVLVGASAGIAIGLRGQFPFGLEPWMWIPIGMATGIAIVTVDYSFQRLPVNMVMGGVAGLISGFLLAGLVGWVGVRICDVGTSLIQLASLALLIGLPSIGMMLGGRTNNRERVSGVTRPVEAATVQNPHNKILDASVIIAGRVADLCETGFLEGTVLVPHCILSELQPIADSSDSLKRARGRRGLDRVNKIQKK